MSVSADTRPCVIISGACALRRLEHGLSEAIHNAAGPAPARSYQVARRALQAGREVVAGRLHV